MFKSWFSISIVGGMIFLCGGCEYVPPASPENGYRDSALALGNGALRLQSGDKIKITVFGEDRLSGDYEIDPGGTVSLPLAGTVRAAGLTKSQFEQLLMRRFRREYLRDPKVTVDVMSFRPFYVIGEASRVGEFAYKSPLNVLTALAIAGGPTYRADDSKVYIQRSGDGGFKEYPMSSEVPIYPGDLIRVPERYF